MDCLIFLSNAICLLLLTGGRGADPHALAQSMQRAVQQFSRKAHSVKEVRIVVFQKQMLRPYLAAFSPDSPQPGGREETGDCCS